MPYNYVLNQDINLILKDITMDS